MPNPLLSRIQHSTVIEQSHDLFQTSAATNAGGIRWVISLSSWSRKHTEKAWEKEEDQTSHTDNTKYKYTIKRFLLNLFTLIPSIIALLLYKCTQSSTQMVLTIASHTLSIVCILISILILIMCYPSDSWEIVHSERLVIRCAKLLPFYTSTVIIIMLLLFRTSTVSDGLSSIITSLVAALLYGSCAFIMAQLIGMGQRYWLSASCLSFVYLMALSWFMYAVVLVIASIPLSYFLNNTIVSFFAGAVLGIFYPAAFSFRQYSLKTAQDVIDAADDLSMQLSAAPVDPSLLSAAAINFDKALDTTMFPGNLSRQKYASPELRYTIMAYVDRLARVGNTEGMPLASYMRTHFPHQRDFSSGKIRLSESLGREAPDDLHTDLTEFLDALRQYLISVSN